MPKIKRYKYNFQDIAPGEAYRYERVNVRNIIESCRLFRKRHASDGFWFEWFPASRGKNVVIYSATRAAKIIPSSRRASLHTLLRAI
jgi:hypothetical protein